jgi:uncharacterized protein
VSEAAPAESLAHLREVIERVAHLLPVQGPIGVFVHHNTLHAFQHLPFETAVLSAAEVFGAEPFLSEERYRQELARGRITNVDVDRVLTREQTLRGGDRPLFEGRLTRAELWRQMLTCGIDDDGGSSLAWRIEELGLLRSLGSTIPVAAARSIVARTTEWLQPMIERGDLPALADALVGHRRMADANDTLVRVLFMPLTLASIARTLEHEPEALAACTLWAACHRRAEDRTPIPANRGGLAPRHRDLLLQATGEDVDDLVNPMIVRLVSAFLDQGIAYWPMPDREIGLYRAMRSIFLQVGAVAAPWLRPLRGLLRAQARRDADAEDVVVDMLTRLGVVPRDWEAYVQRVLLALPGWAGLVHRLEHEPGLAPQEAPPCRLMDLLAVRLVYEYLAVRWLAEEHVEHTGPLADLPRKLVGLAPRGMHGTGTLDRAYRLFQVCQTAGIAAPELLGMADDAIAGALAEVDAFSSIERRRLWQLAYERRHRQQQLSGIALHRATLDPRWRPAAPRAQFVFCIDEREESTRRAIEELGPEYETFGAAGFFGVAMYFRGVDDAHAAALCPVVVTPEHDVREVALPDEHSMAGGRIARRRLWSKVGHGMFVGSRSLVRGWIGTLWLGLFSLLPLVVRVMFPRFTSRMVARAHATWFPKPRTRLTMQRDAEARGEITPQLGFTVDEKTTRVARVLEDAGLRDGFAPIVVVLGHGSTSLNNPHESAHDCGACGGRRGGPNARLFAQMANAPTVREGLRARGIHIPADTWFVGGYHDTCNDAVDLYDLDAVPDTHAGHLAEARRVLDHGRRMDAHERCRRFEAIAAGYTPELALRHVEARAEHLAEPRPEYGHCTNAVCVVGRRASTRGLFLDRRAFLVSYDPVADASGDVLARVLAAVGPVGAGINLEYWFSYVDNERYGCGTKLPHNVTGLVGVMNGHASDLRTGLPWQMVEIHEPVRMLLVVECSTTAIAHVMDTVPQVAELVRNAWIQVALLDPDDGSIRVFADGGFVPLEVERGPLPEATHSTEWYGGRREHLPPARILAACVEPTRARRGAVA